MSESDEGRDLRQALGGLLVGEPTAPWSAADDVARGRALQRRRRTRAGAGLGIAAAAVMAFAVFGPLRPYAAVVEPGGTPPDVPGVSQPWLEAISPALLDATTGIVDWERSRIDGTGSDGFVADLTVVPVTIVTSGDVRTVELARDDPDTGRLTLQWLPGAASPGPALERCPITACPEQGPTSVVGGPIDQGATAGAAAAFPEGTIILDREYDQGLLELVSYPTTPSTTATSNDDRSIFSGGVVASQFLTAIGNPLTGPPGPGPDASFVDAQRAIVEPFLAKAGYVVTDAVLSGVPVDDGRSRVEYTVRPAGGDGSQTAVLIVSAFPTPTGAMYPSGSYLDYCTPTACSAVEVTMFSCIAGASCPSTYWAVATKDNPVLAAPAGMAMLRFESGTALEALVGVLECLTCDPVVTGDKPFLTQAQSLALLKAVDEPGALVSPSPSVTPTAADDAVARVLAGYGFRVTSSGSLPSVSGTGRFYNVDLDRSTADPVTAVLKLTSYPASGVPIGADVIDIEGTVLSGCTSTSCTAVTPIPVPCPSTSCIEYWRATTKAGYVGVDANTLAMFRSDGADGAEAVVGLPRCSACGEASSPREAFLTIAQTQQVLNAFGFPGATPEDQPTALAQCRSGEVKMVAATDPTGGATGERSVAIEVYARNPSVRCTVEGFASVALLVGVDPAPGLSYTFGSYQRPDADRGVAVVVDENHAALFVVAKSRCDAGAVGRADGVAVRLPGSTTSTSVELPDGLAPELCGGAATGAGNEVWISAFTPREGGVR